MTVLIDPPAWPAHDRLWSHLVSTSSLHELRTFARAAGLPDRAFDLDHYDVPAERHDDLVAAGAAPVDGGTLARMLAASPLRVPGHERRRAKRPVLIARWASLWPEGGAADVGSELVDRWREPHRIYHGPLHLADTLDALDLLTRPAPAQGVRLAALALWFHDAVHDGVTPDDEERSAALAHDMLVPRPSCQTQRAESAALSLTTREVEEVSRLVLLTTGHDPDPDDLAGCLVSDADLAILGAAPDRYARYVAQVRAEYSHVGDDDFRDGRRAVVEQLLALHEGTGLFRTPVGRGLWAERAGTNLRDELARLR